MITDIWLFKGLSRSCKFTWPDDYNGW